MVVRAKGAGEVTGRWQSGLLKLGQFVGTPPARSSPVARQVPTLKRLHIWVWRILEVFEVGDALPANTWLPTATEMTYLSQLFAPAAACRHEVTGNPGGCLLPSGVLSPVWDEMSRATFLRTRAEKAYRNSKKAAMLARKRKVVVPVAAGDSGALGDSGASGVVVRCPLSVLLRQGNILGGSFSLTSNDRVPAGVLRAMCDLIQVA